MYYIGLSLCTVSIFSIGHMTFGSFSFPSNSTLFTCFSLYILANLSVSALSLLPAVFCLSKHISDVVFCEYGGGFYVFHGSSYVSCLCYPDLVGSSILGYLPTALLYFHASMASIIVLYHYS